MDMRTRSTSKRAGATLVESAIVTLAFLVLVVGMIDLGRGVLCYNTVSNVARQGARLAIVHGQPDSNGLGTWGPATIGPVALNDPNAPPIAVQLRPYAVGLDQSATQVEAEWIDGGNNQGQRVRVTLTSSYQPFLTSVLGNSPISFSSRSLLAISQ
jgi:Flp pilus assembly protein TadG